MKQKVAAVVLTHDRLDTLKQCISCLRQQTRPLDAILVVNNGGTDTTRAWLDAQADLIPLHQENLGTGGGFGNGIKEVIRLGYDWAWCFDDDAFASPTALEEICRVIAARPGARVLSSLGVSQNDHERFACGGLWVRTDAGNYLAGQLARTRRELANYTDADGIVDSLGGHFWLGILIHRGMVETVGVPSLQINWRGDEVEYGLRIMRAGYHIPVVAKSIVYHPQVPFVTIRFFGKSKDLRLLSAAKRYFAIRNAIWIRKIYYKDSLLLYGVRRIAGVLLTDLILAPHLSLKERLASARAAVRGVWDGLMLPLPTDTGTSPLFSIDE